MDDRRKIARFVALNFGLGALIGFAFVMAVLVLDVSGLRTLATTTEGGTMAVMLLLMGFISLASGAMLSTAPQDNLPTLARATQRRKR